MTSPLGPDDPRLVPLNDACGDVSESRILKAMGVDPAAAVLRWQADRGPAVMARTRPGRSTTSTVAASCDCSGCSGGGTISS